MSDSTPFTARLPRIILNVAIILGVAYALQRLQPATEPTQTAAETETHAPEKSPFQINVSGVRSDEGVVRVAVFLNADDFPNHENATFTVSGHADQAVDGTITLPIALESDAKTRVAIAAYHDVNDDGNLNKNRIGIPTESYGFSNKARGSFGPPTFEQAAIETSAPTNIEIK